MSSSSFSQQKSVRKLLIASALLLFLCILAWSQRITIARTYLQSSFDLQLELETLEISPGSLLSVRGIGLHLKGRQFEAKIEEIYVELRLDQLRGNDYYLARIEGSNGTINITRTEADRELPSEEEEQQGQTIRWLPESYDLNNIQVQYQDDDQDIHAILDECRATRVQEVSEININCHGQLQRSPLKLTGRYGLPDPAGTAEPLDVQVHWGQYRLTAEGKLDALSRLKGADLNLTLSAPTSQPLMELLGASEVRDGIVDLDGSITHEASDYTIRLAGQLSEIAFSVDGTVADLEVFAPVEANFNVAGPSLFEIGALFNEFRLQPQPFSTTGHVSFSTDHLALTDVSIGIEQGLITANLNMPGFPETKDMEVDLRAENFKPNVLKPVADLCQLPQELVNVEVNVVVTDPGQTLEIYLDGPSYDVKATGNLNRTPGTAQLDIDIAGTSLQTLGHCLAISLPDDPAQLTTRLAYADSKLTFSDLLLSSNLADIDGDLELNLNEPLTFQTKLGIDVPDVQLLIDEIADYRGPLKRFPLKGDLSMNGSLNQIDITSLRFEAAGQVGSLQGTLGNPRTLAGLQMSLAMEGDNLRDLIGDAESNANHEQPYQLNTLIAKEANAWLIQGLDLELVNTRVKMDGRLTRLPLYLGSYLEVEASGENIQNLLGPWLDHPIPELPFSLETNIDFKEKFFRFENLRATVGEHALQADLSIDRPPDYSNTFGHLALQGPRTQELVALLGLDWDVLDRPYELSFNMTGDLDRLVVNELTSSIAETDVSGQIVFQNKSHYLLDVDLVSRSFYLPLIYPSLVDEGNQDEPVVTGDKRVFSDQPIPRSWLQAFEGEVTWDIHKAWSTEEYKTEVLLDLSLQNAELVGRNIRWDSEDSTGNIKFRLNESKDALGLTLEATSSRLPLVWLLTGESLPSEGTSFRALLSSNGQSIRHIMGNLNGTVLWQGGRGHIQSNRLELLFGDFLTSATSAIIGGESAEERRRTLVSCTAGGIHFNDGIAYLAPGIVSRTDRTDFYASGSIDLEKEKLKLVFLTKSRTGIGLSPLKVIAPRLRVGGTMTEPRFSVGTTSTALSTSAAFFSGGVSVLATGLWDRMSTSSDACVQLHEQALKLNEFGNHRPD